MIIRCSNCVYTLTQLTETHACVSPHTRTHTSTYARIRICAHLRLHVNIKHKHTCTHRVHTA